MYGYEFFVRQVNCAKNQKDKSFVDHIIKAAPYNGSQDAQYAEGPNHRPDTGNRSLRASARPSAWMAACHTPLLREGWGTQMYVMSPSHFGSTRARAQGGGESFRFNVLHVDGHVHDDVWKEYLVDAVSWLPKGDGYSTANRPYGWWLKGPYGDGCLKTTPMFEGAFDQNKGEFREVAR
jgi:prepilin-type processing-associated H-X9-DG protein